VNEGEKTKGTAMERRRDAETTGVYLYRVWYVLCGVVTKKKWNTRRGARQNETISF
jgi:hypothetical protein